MMKVVARRKLASTSKEAPESHQSSFVFTRQTLNSLLLDLYSAHGTYGYEESSLEWKPFLSDIMAWNYPPSSSLSGLGLSSIFFSRCTHASQQIVTNARSVECKRYLSIPSFLPSFLRAFSRSVFLIVDGISTKITSPFFL